MSDAPVTTRAFRAALTQVAKSIGELLMPLRNRIKALEQRCAELDAAIERRSYQGVYDSERTYDEHNLVTMGGNIWIARRATSDRPGTSDAWTLAVKKGRDGRDAK
jgi:hypothetical protein